MPQQVFKKISSIIIVYQLIIIMNRIQAAILEVLFLLSSFGTEAQNTPSFYPFKGFHIGITGQTEYFQKSSFLQFAGIDPAPKARWTAGWVNNTIDGYYYYYLTESYGSLSVNNNNIYTQLSYIHTISFQKAKKYLKKNEYLFSTKKERRVQILNLLK